MGKYTSADMINKAEKCMMVIKMNNQEKTDYSGKRAQKTKNLSKKSKFAFVAYKACETS